MTTTTEAAAGFQWPGGASGGSPGFVRGVRFDGAVGGGNFAASDFDGTETRGIQARGIALSSPVAGAQFSPTVGSAAAFGGQWDGPVSDSVSSLIDVSGFALVLERRQGGDRLAFSPDQPPYRDIKSVGWTEEPNAMASWEATVPANPDLFDWPFERVVVAYDGDRRFHGTLLPIEEGTRRDGEMTLSGYGPLFWAGHDHLSVRYEDMAAYRALSDIWQRVTRQTDGRVRGQVVRPRPEHINAHWIPSEGVEWSGTPMEVLKKAHGYAGQVFAADRADHPAIFQSFVPGEELRTVAWRATDINPSVSPEGYHNQVTVLGADNPPRAEPYNATATAPRAEIDRVMGGQIHSRTERDTSLTSEQACRARAETLLAEDRGGYTIGGSLDVTPGVRDLVPGYTYRVAEFDSAAPGFFTPVYASLRSVSHSYAPGEATVSLDFDDESGLTQHIREDLLPEQAPRAIKRRDSQVNAADANYDRPAGLDYEYGSGVWGSGKFGGTAEDT